MFGFKIYCFFGENVKCVISFIRVIFLEFCFFNVCDDKFLMVYDWKCFIIILSEVFCKIWLGDI